MFKTSTALYDEALVLKLKNWTEKTDITVYNSNETSRVIEVNSDRNLDRPLKLPMLILERDKGFEILNRGNRPLTHDGMTLDANILKSSQLNAIPISIAYKLHVYTRYFEEADAYMRDIVFNVINHPKLTVSIPYNDNYIDLDSNIIISEAKVTDDSSNVKERLLSGEFTCLTLSIKIDDAYLWDLRVRNNFLIEAIPKVFLERTENLW